MNHLGDLEFGRFTKDDCLVADADAVSKSYEVGPATELILPRAGTTCREFIFPGEVNVSIHAPARGATRGRNFWTSDRPGFDPRPRAGGDAPMVVTGRVVMFRSTPPRGGRPDRSMVLRAYLSVSIHAPARGATLARYRRSPRSRRFDPRPRAGGDTAEPAVAPTSPSFDPRPRAGGDLRPMQRMIASGHVSIHAPARGATSARHHTPSMLAMFRSTPPRGGRLRPADRSHRAHVSIHAPARGATRRPCKSRTRSCRFRSTPPRGGRLQRRQQRCRMSEFRSTPPRGGRPQRSLDQPASSRCFDPRPRAGGDVGQTVAHHDRLMFRSTPPRGGRPANGRSQSPCGEFRSTPPRGGRPSIVERL